jgi:hypothetical protein
MDILSHGLWGGAALGRRNRRTYLIAFGLSVLPDLLAEGVMFSLAFLKLEGMPSLENGHPNIADFPVYAQNFYNMTHSLVIFLTIFFIIWVIRKKPFYLLTAWAVHIVIDIPTHSLKLFPTPLLWPISDYRFNGTSWDNPIIMIPNILMLGTVYGIWIYRRRTS